MSDQLYTFAPLIPAGTLQGAPVTVGMKMPTRIVDRITVLVPPGPNGLMGFALGAAGVPVVPARTNSWIVANDETLAWELPSGIESGAWQLFGYNLGANDHTVYVRFEVSLPPVGPPTAAGPVVLPDLSTLSSFTATDLDLWAAQADDDTNLGVEP